MSFRVVRRAALLIPSNPQGDLAQKHLFVIMCDPDPQGDVLLVPVSTYKEGRKGHDDTCLLEQGDHPFIKHRSYIKYRSARQEPADKLKQGVANKLYVAHEMIDDDVFQRILEGFGRSRLVSQFVFNYLPPPNPFR